MQLVYSGEPFRTAQSLSLYSPGMGQALIRSGWMMLAVLGLNHVCSPAQTGELGLTTVSIAKMWQFPVLAFVSLALTAATSALHCPVSLAHGCINMQYHIVQGQYIIAIFCIVKLNLPTQYQNQYGLLKYGYNYHFNPILAAYHNY